MDQTPHRQVQRPRRWLRLAALALAFVFVGAACGSDDTADSADTDSAGITVQSPDELEGAERVEATDAPAAVEGLPDAPPSVDFVWFDGRAGSTGELVGQPTVLNFWASTCAACIAEMPEFEEVHAELAGRVDFVGVNVADQRSAAEELAEITGVTYPLIDDPDSLVFRNYDGWVMPTTVFLNEAGQPAYTWSGVLTGEELRILIDRHIAPGSLDV